MNQDDLIGDDEVNETAPKKGKCVQSLLAQIGGVLGLTDEEEFDSDDEEPVDEECEEAE